MTLKSFKNLILSASALCASAFTFATPVYEFSVNNPAGNSNGGIVENVTTAYDADNELFHWSSTLGQVNGQYTDGFWLVISDGPNPKSSGGEYAIMCGDLSTGRLNIFEYNGVNGNNSCYSNAGYIQSSNAGFINVADNGASRTFDFTLDVSAINSFYNTSDWDGISFDDNVGIWYHPSRNSNFTYNGNGQLTNYSFQNQGWYDTSYQNATPVPAPAAFFLFLLALPLAFRKK